MTDDDLIRRGDALAAVAKLYKWSIAAGEELEDAIAALPAVTVGVPCTWPSCGHTAKGQCQGTGVRILAALEPVAAPRRYMGQIMAECDCSRQGECEAAQKCLAVAAPDLTDPVVVHANMLRGTISKPTVEQIIHLYGVDALVKALAPVIVREAHVNETPKSEHDAGNVLTPDPAAIREAALREAAEIVGEMVDGALTVQAQEHAIQCQEDILALIQNEKGTTND